MTSSLSFHPPTTFAHVCMPETMSSIDQLLAARPMSPDGFLQAIRIDFLVDHSDSLMCFREGSVLALTAPHYGGALARTALGDFGGSARKLVGDMLVALNDDSTLSDGIGEHAQKIPGPAFASAVRDRWLSLTFIGERCATISQENIPGWYAAAVSAGYAEVDVLRYAGSDCPATQRAELFSIVAQDVPGAHARLTAARALGRRAHFMAALFDSFADGDNRLALRSANIADAF